MTFAAPATLPGGFDTGRQPALAAKKLAHPQHQALAVPQNPDLHKKGHQVIGRCVTQVQVRQYICAQQELPRHRVFQKEASPLTASVPRPAAARHVAAARVAYRGDANALVTARGANISRDAPKRGGGRQEGQRDCIFLKTRSCALSRALAILAHPSCRARLQMIFWPTAKHK